MCISQETIDRTHELVNQYRAQIGLPPWEFTRKPCQCGGFESIHRPTVIGGFIVCCKCRGRWTSLITSRFKKSAGMYEFNRRNSKGKNSKAMAAGA